MTHLSVSPVLSSRFKIDSGQFWNIVYCGNVSQRHVIGCQLRMSLSYFWSWHICAAIERSLKIVKRRDVPPRYIASKFLKAEECAFDCFMWIHYSSWTLQYRQFVRRHHRAINTEKVRPPHYSATRFWCARVWEFFGGPVCGSAIKQLSGNNSR